MEREKSAMSMAEDESRVWMADLAAKAAEVERKMREEIERRKREEEERLAAIAEAERAAEV